jgi:hypothetical protein
MTLRHQFLDFVHDCIFRSRSTTVKMANELYQLFQVVAVAECHLNLLAVVELHIATLEKLS